jgi:hypothetical protein
MNNRYTLIITILLATALLAVLAYYYDISIIERADVTQQEEHTEQVQTQQPAPIMQTDDTAVKPISQQQTAPPQTDSSVSAPSSAAPKETGRLFVTVTDNTVPINSVDSIFLTISDLTARNDQGQWVSISSAVYTYDLLQLKLQTKEELALDTQYPADMYDNLSFKISGVAVVSNGIAKTAILPAHTIYMPINLLLTPGRAYAISLDFAADKSLHSTNTQQYVFAPVVTITVTGEIQTVQRTGTQIEFAGGLPKFNARYGMDELGTIRKNSTGIDSSSALEIWNGKFALIPNAFKRSDFKQTPEEAMRAALDSSSLASIRAVYAHMLETQPYWRVEGLSPAGAITSVYAHAKTGVIEKVELQK